MIPRFTAFANWILFGIIGSVIELNGGDGRYFGLCSILFMCTWLIMLQIHMSEKNSKQITLKREDIIKAKDLMVH